MATWKRVITPLIGDPEIDMFDLATNQYPSYPYLPTTLLTNNMVSSGQHYFSNSVLSSITIENLSDYIVGVVGSENSVIYPQSSVTIYGDGDGTEVYLTAALVGGGCRNARIRRAA